jgi:hypothetical protein
MNFNGKNYNGFVFINNEKMTLETAEPQIREWFFEQIQIESGLYSKIESVKARASEKWAKVNIEEAKQLLSKVAVDRLLDFLYTPSQAWSGICKKYNLNNY